MAAVDVGGPSPRGKKTGGIRRPKKRLGVRIDMTPMVDIAFLLLIFYMVTTIFSLPQAMEINLPPEEQPVPIAESNLLTLRVDSEGKIYWNMGVEKPELMPPDSLRPIIFRRNLENMAKYTGVEKPETLPVNSLENLLFSNPKNLDKLKLVTLIKIQKDAKYYKMIDIVDDIQLFENRINQWIKDQEDQINNDKGNERLREPWKERLIWNEKERRYEIKKFSYRFAFAPFTDEDQGLITGKLQPKGGK